MEDNLYQNPTNPPAPKKSVGRLVIGIIAIVLSVVSLMQSCAVAGLGAMIGTEDGGGMIGIVLALCLLVAGIVDIATRNASGKAPAVVSIAFYAFGALIGFAMATGYSDLKIWAGVCLLFAALDVVFLVLKLRSAKQA